MKGAINSQCVCNRLRLDEDHTGISKQILVTKVNRYLHRVFDSRTDTRFSMKCSCGHLAIYYRPDLLFVMLRIARCVITSQVVVAESPEIGI
jgi:hypothetical protein